MPNWCVNSVEIIGSESDLQDIAKRVDNADSLLEGLYPLLNDDGTKMDWDYSVWVDVYGTKWNDELLGDPVFIGSNRLEIPCQTAWAPPCDGILGISQLWPNCVFGLAYTEPGMCFAGLEIVYNGIVDVEHSQDYPDFGNWDDDPDGCSDRQVEFEQSIYETLTEEMDKYVNFVMPKVRKLSDTTGS